MAPGESEFDTPVLKYLTSQGPFKYLVFINLFSHKSSYFVKYWMSAMFII